MIMKRTEQVRKDLGVAGVIVGKDSINGFEMWGGGR